jgi:cell division protein FtsB
LLILFVIRVSKRYQNKTATKSEALLSNIKKEQQEYDADKARVINTANKTEGNGLKRRRRWIKILLVLAAFGYAGWTLTSYYVEHDAQEAVSSRLAYLVYVYIYSRKTFSSFFSSNASFLLNSNY